MSILIELKVSKLKYWIDFQMENQVLNKDVNEIFNLGKVFLDSNSYMNFVDIWDEIFGGQR